jgi:hypothetical protein
MMTHYKFTGYETEKAFFDELGIPSDDNSHSELYEWHWIVLFTDVRSIRELWNEFAENSHTMPLCGSIV